MPATKTKVNETTSDDDEFASIFGQSISSVDEVGEPTTDTPGERPARADRTGRQIKKLGIQGGKEMYQYRDVLNEAHRLGLVGFVQIHPPMIFTDNNGNVTAAVCSVSALFSDGTEWQGVGDCDNVNGGKVAGGAKPRMADTRAKARALGDALNLDANFHDEMGPEGAESSVSFTPRTQVSLPSPAKFSQPTGGIPSPGDPGYDRYYRDDRLPDETPNDGDRFICEEPGCENELTDTDKWSAHKKAQWSRRDYGKIVCFTHGKGRQS